MEGIAMAEFEEILRVFETSLSQIKWRLKLASKRRLQTDILALCSRMRPVIMVDYGGKMPELGDHLCEFVGHCRKESTIFELLRVMVIDEMIYLIQVEELANFVKSSSTTETAMLFVDLENDPPKMMTEKEKNSAMMQLLSAEELFSSVFCTDGVSNDHLKSHGPDSNGGVSSESCELVDLSCCLEKSQVTIPTLNGWLLGYPVVYLFGKEYIQDAVYNLSTKSLHIYRIFVNRMNATGKVYEREELMSFTVPYELSLEGENEPWAKSFLAHMRGRWEKCKNIWGSLHMEVSSCYAQAIAL